MWTSGATYDEALNRHPRASGDPAQQQNWAPAFAGVTNLAKPSALFDHAPAARAEPAVEPVPSYPLGVARGQVAATYIVAEAEDGLVIVDQHAAHERLVLERMRAAAEGGGGPATVAAHPRGGRARRTRLRPARSRSGRPCRARPRDRALRPDLGPRARCARGTRPDRRQAAWSPTSPRRSPSSAGRSACATGSTMSPRPSPATARSARGESCRSPR